MTKEEVRGRVVGALTSAQGELDAYRRIKKELGSRPHRVPSVRFGEGGVSRKAEVHWTDSEERLHQMEVAVEVKV